MESTASNPRRTAWWFKIVAAAALITYAVATDKIDRVAVLNALRSPALLLFHLAALTVLTAVLVLRWRAGIRAVSGERLSFLSLFRTSMISGFVSVFGAGSLGADAAKVLGTHRGLSLKLATQAVVLERGLGVVAASGAAAFGALAFGVELPLGFRTVGMLVTVLGLALVAWMCRRGSRAGLIAVVAALVGQALQVAVYWVQGWSQGLSWSGTEVLVLGSAAHIAAMFSFLPLGIGAGPIAFYFLFERFSQVSPAEAASACAVAQVYSLLFHAAGGWFAIALGQRSENRSAEEISRAA